MLHVLRGFAYVKLNFAICLETVVTFWQNPECEIPHSCVCPCRILF